MTLSPHLAHPSATGAAMEWDTMTSPLPTAAQPGYLNYVTEMRGAVLGREDTGWRADSPHWVPLDKLLTLPVFSVSSSKNKANLVLVTHIAIRLL